MDNDGKPIYFDSIDNSAYIMGKSPHSARTSWMYMDGENFSAVRADIGGDPENPDLSIAWKYTVHRQGHLAGSDSSSSAPSARSTTSPWIPTKNTT